MRIAAALGAFLLLGWATCASASCPAGTTMVIVKNVLEVCEIADRANHKLLLPDPSACPEGTSSATLPGGQGVCRRPKGVQLRDIILPIDGECPAGYRHAAEQNGQTVCESTILLPTSDSAAGAEACPEGTIPIINLSGLKDCRRDSRVAIDKLYVRGDGCPINAAPGTDQHGSAACYQR